MDYSLVSLLFLGFSLGVVHALDADHVMAVTSMTQKGASLKGVLRFGAHWALGHGSILILAGIMLLGLGTVIPEIIQKSAEIGVGVLLITVGCGLLLQLYRRGIHIHRHEHNGVVHSHLQVANEVVHRKHTPVLVGILHGLAGSAPALAILPAIAQKQLSIGIAYLALFSFGVLVSMMVFAFALGVGRHFLKEKFIALFHWSRIGVAASSIVLGSYWVIHAY